MADEQRNQELLTFLTRIKEGQYAEIPPYAMDHVRVSDVAECELESDQDNYIYSYCC